MLAGQRILGVSIDPNWLVFGMGALVQAGIGIVTIAIVKTDVKWLIKSQEAMWRKINEQ